MIASDALLMLSEVTVRFGGITAVDRVSLGLRRGELLGLLGPNGAGKTTLLRSISGMVTPQEGTVHLEGQDIAGLSMPARVRRGIGLSNQIVRPFRRMTLLENVTLAAGGALTSSPLKALLHADRSSAQMRALECLDLVGIADRAGQMAGSQPLGVLKRLEVARALATSPRVLLLDEPLAGLGHGEAIRLADTIADLNRQGTTIVLIEHNLGEVLRICPRLVVLDYGRKIADGPADAVIRQREVVEAYVGAGGDHALA